MEPAIKKPGGSKIPVLLAGLQAGMLGALAMLGWLGLAAKMQNRSFWTPANLMASVFFGDRAIRNEFGAKTFSGLALYLFMYSLLGAIFALVVADRQSRFRILLLSLLFSVGWYYFAFDIVWKTAAPLLWLLYSPRPMVLGHLVYGTFLSRYPVHLPRKPAPEPALPTATETPEDVPVSAEPNPGPNTDGLPLA
jgi:hypothetical protein